MKLPKKWRHSKWHRSKRKIHRVTGYTTGFLLGTRGLTTKTACVARMTAVIGCRAEARWWFDFWIKPEARRR